MWVLNVLFWVVFAATFFLIVNQLMYQEHSIIFSWHKSSPGYTVFWLMLSFWCGIFSIALFYYHHWRAALSLLCLGAAWVIFFLMYVRMIEIDVQNKISAGDLPDGPAKFVLPESAAQKVKDWASKA